MSLMQYAVNRPSSQLDAPVTTSFPLVNKRHVHTGSASRMVMAANFDLSYVLYGKS